MTTSRIITSHWSHHDHDNHLLRVELLYLQQVVVVGIRHIELAGGEFRVVGEIDTCNICMGASSSSMRLCWHRWWGLVRRLTFVTELPADLVDPLQAADDKLL